MCSFWARLILWLCVSGGRRGVCCVSSVFCATRQNKRQPFAQRTMRRTSVLGGHHAPTSSGTRHPPAHAFAPAPSLRSIAPRMPFYYALRSIADAQKFRRAAIASTQPNIVDDWNDAAACEDAPAAGTALQATLQALEWHRLCEDLASFAKTSLGAQSCLPTHPPFVIYLMPSTRQAAAAGTAPMPTTQPSRHRSSHRPRA